MKIILFTDDFPPEASGGAGIMTASLAMGLLEAGHDVLIITAGLDNAEYDYKGVHVFRIKNSLKKRIVFKNEDVENQAAKIIQKFDPDICHLHSISSALSFNLINRIKKDFPTIKIFLTLHDTMALAYGRMMAVDFCDDIKNCQVKNYKIGHLKLLAKRKFKINPFERNKIFKTLKLADKIFAVSGELKKAYEVNGIKNIIVIHNGIRVENFCQNMNIEKIKSDLGIAGKNIILLAGRIGGSKGLGQAMEVIKKVNIKNDKAFLLLAGRIDAKQDSTSESDFYNTLNIKSMGWLDELEMREVFCVADIVLVPSVYLDPFPTVNLEAMAAAKPVIGTCFGGTPEVVTDGVTGFVINPYDTDKMADRTQYLLDNPDMAKKMGEAGYKKAVNEFSLEAQIQKILYWYDVA